MKLGLKRGDTVFSAIIRARLSSKYSHSAILIGDTIYESTLLGGGVHSSKASPEVLSHYKWSHEFGNDSQALSRFKEREGNGYDLFSQLAFILPGTYGDSKRDYCFENSKFVMGGEVNGRETPETLLDFVLENYAFNQ